MDTCADGVRLAYPLFQAEGSGSIPTSALDLRFVVVELSLAKSLNKLWHSRLPILTSPAARVCYAGEFDGVYYAAAVWCRPLARLNPQKEWIELQRLAVAPDAPRNSCSRMLGWMARDIKERFPDVERLISYQDLEVHAGTIYRAAGWTPTVRAKFTPWDNNSRKRNKAQTTGEKQRWEKVIREEKQ